MDTAETQPPSSLPDSPLTDRQMAAVQWLLGSLSPTQVVWLSRFLLGALCERSLVQGELRLSHHIGGEALEPSGAKPARATAPKVTALFGTNTGHAEQIARALVRNAGRMGISVELRSMADYEPAWLRHEQILFIVVSTHGDGDPPDSARRLYDFLQGPRAPKLSGLTYAVLGLGDRTYTHFCKTGRAFDERLVALGATRLLDRVDCDLDYEPSSTAWVARALATAQPLVSAQHTELKQATFLETEDASPWHVAGGTIPAVPQTNAKPQAPRQQPEPSRDNPFLAEITENLVLSGRGSGKETRHIELSLAGSGIRYEPGDSLAVVPKNDRTYVEALLSAARLDGNEQVQLEHATTPLATALESAFDVRLPTRAVLRKYAAMGAPALESLLADDACITEYLRGRELLDVVRAFPIVGLSAAQFLSALPSLEARRYSIASCLDVFPDEAHLMVAVVRYRACDRDQRGVGSGYLADGALPGHRVPVYICPNREFRLPDDPELPIIMIGPGTGVAPFRGFMQKRRASAKRGPSWLFFGDRTFLADFSYQVEWEKLRKDGVLTRMDVAFSRDPPERKYVQHRLLERAHDVYDWLQGGAHVYVCGDRLRMAKDVDHALAEVVATQRDVSIEAAREYLAQLKAERRYHRDVY